MTYFTYGLTTPTGSHNKITPGSFNTSEKGGGSIKDHSYSSVLARIKSDASSLQAEFGQRPKAVFVDADWTTVKGTEMPRTEETRKADEQDRLWAAKFPNGQARQAERERLKDEAGCNHIRFTNTVSSEDNIPVTFYQMSTNGDQTKVGTGIAKFVSEYSVDIQIPELIEADVTTPHIPPLGYTREDGSYCRVFKDVKEVKHYISKIKDVRDLHGSYGVPGYQTEKWLELTSITIPKDDINPDTSTIISVEVENTPQEEFWLTFSRRWPKRDRCMSVPGTTHSQRTIEYSDLKWDINFDPEKI